MTTDLHLAFAHPEERAEATAGADPRDRISLRDHVVEADIGAFQTERGTRQRLRFNVVVETRPHPAPLDDDVDRILSYDRIAESIADELSDHRVNLLETLAEGVAARLLREPQAMRTFVRIEKLDRGPGALGVEIVRSRQGDATPAVGGGTIHPVVAFLSNPVIGGDDLPARLDALERLGAPLILCVGLPETPHPASAARPVQRRIDLLAIEQNAWLLAGRDRRCLVVESRTEIDWAMRHGRTIVWAPSKIVLDAADGPKGSARDAVALALWLAEHMAAQRLVILGDATVPNGGPVPVDHWI